MKELVQSVHRALCTLQVLSYYEDGLRIGEVSEKASLYKSNN